ncbi:hypothetical protein BDN71DRAFT_1564213 [Pleurotus eryngii]|uniref:Uncharacterized protein n=1 Tax=Pleurotus eryngii TaxID=5323 RepID=A0A9P5ZXE3_PLEER|nr:hypothetical protein BDN71DRAFT_1564213 [Pleurotus eryngii]
MTMMMMVLMQMSQLWRSMELKVPSTEKGINNVWLWYYNAEGVLLTWYPSVKAQHLQEKYSSKLPIMEVIYLPSHLRHSKATRTVPDTQLPMAMTLCDGDSMWEGATYKYTSDCDVTFTAHDCFTCHWLRDPVMMHKKFQILILDTLFDDSSYQTDNVVSGYTVVTEVVDCWAEQVFVKMGEQRNLSTKKILLKKIILYNLFLRHGEQVIVIRVDVVSNDQIIGMAGWVNESPYSLDEGIQLVTLAEPPGFVYVPEVNLCRTGAPVLWKGDVYN